jgi:hypothetical protein
MTLIDQIKSVASRKDLHALLSTSGIEKRHYLLSNVIDLLNREVECDITTGDIEVAIFKMSQVVLLEDELMIVERVMLKQSVLAR